MVFKIFLIIFCLFLPFAVYGSVIINEIAWMGTEVSYNDEWIELYNNTKESINLDAWVLKADDGSPEINLSGIIPAKGFYLLERTDDETVPEITADLIYKGALGNSGENLKLYDNSGNIIDQVNCTGGWLAGDNETKQTMERINSEWQTSQDSGGTPKEENYELRIMNYEDDKPEPESEPEPEKKITPMSYPAGIVFNEILPSPEGPDAENEWIELYNQNNFEVDLSGWTIKDIIGSAKTYTLNGKIPALGYLILLRPETKITLNNTGDGLNLTNPNGEVVDSVDFGKASLNQSYSKISSDWAWNNNLTPGEKNIILEEKPSFAKASEGKKSETGSLSTSEEKTTDINLLTQKSKPPVWLIALIVAIFSGIAILIVKNSLF